MQRKGVFITFEGLDGSGKSTQVQALRKYLDEKNINYLISREPGGTELGEKLRKVLLDVKNTKICDRTEALIYAAARSQHIFELLLPAVEEGKLVICDRYIDSSIAYQGYGRDMLDEVGKINESMLNLLTPDMTFLLNANPNFLKYRINSREKDRMESETDKFRKKVYNGYLELSKENPDRIVVLDATLTKGKIRAEIRNRVEKLLTDKGFL